MLFMLNICSTNEGTLCPAIPRPVGRGGSRGFARTPLLELQKIFMYTSKLHILSILPLESGPLVSLLLRITAVQTSLVAATVVRVCSCGGPARNARVSCLRRCDERTRLRYYRPEVGINKSLLHLRSRVVLRAMSPIYLLFCQK